MWPAAEVTLTPVLRWDGGQLEGRAFGFQGEEAPDLGGTVVPYLTGGKVTGKVSYDYRPEMAKSELVLLFALTYGDYKKNFSLKAADGVVSN